MNLRSKVANTELEQEVTNEEGIWLTAEYHAHVFHYRMPGTVAIAAVSPLIPSPLTVKMALVAALARDGEIERANRIAAYLPRLDDTTFYLIPPEAAVTFKALMRYVRPAASGKSYTISPHIREYALWQDCFTVILFCPMKDKALFTTALWNIAYLGTKDSMVTCLSVEDSTEKPDVSLAILKIKTGQEITDANGPLFRLADFNFTSKRKPVTPTLEELIPFNRKAGDYLSDGFYLLPGTLRGSGRAKLYHRAPLLLPKEGG